MPFRPILDLEPINGTHSLAIVQQLVVDCWAEEPPKRPPAHHIKHVLDKAMRAVGLDGSRSLFDRIMSRLQKYAQTLEETVEERTVQLMEERERCDMILSEMLPR